MHRQARATLNGRLALHRPVSEVLVAVMRIIKAIAISGDSWAMVWWLVAVSAMAFMHLVPM